MVSLLSLILLWTAHGLPLQNDEDVALAERQIVRTVDRDGLERCMRDIAGFSLAMQCRIDAEGRGRDCQVLNPTAATRRRDRVFQCMASQMRFHYADGAPAEGELVQFRLGGQTLLGDGEYARARNAQRQQP